jgi:hypothetical protein
MAATDALVPDLKVKYERYLEIELEMCQLLSDGRLREVLSARPHVPRATLWEASPESIANPAPSPWNA